MNYVTVKFKTKDSSLSAQYSYMTNLELQPGDWVVVEYQNEYKCALVSKTKGLSIDQRNKASKWIISKVDVEAYERLKARGEAIIEIKRKLRERKEQAEEFIIYQQLAAIDPEIEKLIGELQALDPSFSAVTRIY